MDQSTPYVAGIIAYLISSRGNMTPAAMATLLNSVSLQGILAGICGLSYASEVRIF